MPVAVRLSRNFYERFGDDATNELIALLNDVDFTHRTELKDAFAGSLAVFDAKLEQRLAEQMAEIDRRFVEMDAKFERRLAEMDAKFERRFASVDVEFAKIRGEIKNSQAVMIRWMFAFWVASTATTISAFAAFAR
jgi:ABC-type phosphate transport system auxiliary subunit